MSSAGKLQSWVPGADGSGFSVYNLCYGVAECENGGSNLVMAIGDFALDLASCARMGLWDDTCIDRDVWTSPSLNAFLALGCEKHQQVRRLAQKFLSDERRRSQVEPHLRPRGELSLKRPIIPGDFIDFYSSNHHAVRAMKAAGHEPKLDLNWHAMPVGYHSRSGTVIGSGERVVRPHGPRLTKAGPGFGVTQSLDFELEVGFIVCSSTTYGERLTAESFSENVFGMVLLNDWSARDFQAWESKPLGPFLAKSFASQISPWVVPLAALDEARHTTPSQYTALPYLQHAEPWGFDIRLNAAIQSADMRRNGLAPDVVTRTNLKHMHWNSAQQLAHATANGAAVQPGDLFGSGTVSGPELESAGCLLELTNAGREPLSLSDGTSRLWLEDGDRVLIRGSALGPHGSEISFGELWGDVENARIG